jgi:hypothetical protein
MRVPGERRCRLGSGPLRAGPHRRLAGVAGRSAARSGNRAVDRELSDAGVDHVRELSARAAGRPPASAYGTGGRDRAGRRDRGARAAADLPGRFRLSGVRATGRAARPRSVYTRGSRSAHRPGVQVHRLALPALALRPAVHAAELRAGAARARWWPVGVEGDCPRLEPRRGGAGRARGEAPRALRELGGGVRRPEPRDAAAGARRRAQRHAAGAGRGRRAGAHRGGRRR